MKTNRRSAHPLVVLLVAAGAVCLQACVSATPVATTRLDVWVDAVKTYDIAGEEVGVRTEDVRDIAEALRQGVVSGLRQQGFTVTSSRVTSSGLLLSPEVTEYRCVETKSDSFSEAEACQPPFWVNPPFGDDPELRRALEDLLNDLIHAAEDETSVTPRPELQPLVQGDAVLIVVMTGNHVGFGKQVLQALTSATLTDALTGASVAVWNTSWMAWAGYVVSPGDGRIHWQLKSAGRFPPSKLSFRSLGKGMALNMEPGGVSP